MDHLSAAAMGAANRGKPQMVFDWAKAARLIRDTRPTTASAGLQRDWEYTGATIYDDGAPVPERSCQAYYASTWATPELELDGMDGTVIVDCYVMEGDTSWDAWTYWPDEALAILYGWVGELEGDSPTGFVITSTPEEQ